jgi:hypothetical protein
LHFPISAENKIQFKTLAWGFTLADQLKATFQELFIDLAPALIDQVELAVCHWLLISG